MILCNRRVRRIIGWIKAPTFFCPLTLSRSGRTSAIGLRSPDAFTLRRRQILLASADGAGPPPRSPPASVSCLANRPQRLPRLPRRRASTASALRSHRPASARSEFDAIACERLLALLHRSPREFGKPTSIWSLELAAHVAFARGITARRVSGESVRQR